MCTTLLHANRTQPLVMYYYYEREWCSQIPLRCGWIVYLFVNGLNFMARTHTHCLRRSTLKTRPTTKDDRIELTEGTIRHWNPYNRTLKCVVTKQLLFMEAPPKPTTTTQTKQPKTNNLFWFEIIWGFSFVLLRRLSLVVHRLPWIRIEWHCVASGCVKLFFRCCRHCRKLEIHSV